METVIGAAFVVAGVAWWAYLVRMRARGLRMPGPLERAPWPWPTWMSFVWLLLLFGGALLATASVWAFLAVVITAAVMCWGISVLHNSRLARLT